MKNIIFKVIVILFIFLIPLSVYSENNIAFLTIENKTIDPRYDYLEGIIKGVLLYDLSNTENINIVERSQLESILQEQKLQLTGLTQNNDQAIKVGKLLNADYLLKGDYIFLGTDVLININLINVETASVVNFTERGSTENTIHGLSENIIERLTGLRQAIKDPLKERSIISLRDEKPGSIDVYSYLIDAEIFLDGEFIGYTTGDKQKPFYIENVSSGYHTLGIKLVGFGMVKLPEFTFHNWEKQIKVSPGKKLTIKADVDHFNSFINRKMKLLYEDIRFKYTELPVNKEHIIDFQDREDKEININLNLSISGDENNKAIEIVFDYNGSKLKYKLSGSDTSEKSELDETIGIVRFRSSLDKYEFSYSIYRTDIYPNMYYK